MMMKMAHNLPVILEEKKTTSTWIQEDFPEEIDKPCCLSGSGWRNSSEKQLIKSMIDQQEIITEKIIIQIWEIHIRYICEIQRKGEIGR